MTPSVDVKMEKNPLSRGINSDVRRTGVPQLIW
jgi:hypothetical protein